MLNNVFSTILDMTITGSIVILVVLAARLALKRMPKILSYCLWAAVLFRLLCPVSISLPVSAVPEVPSVKENYTLSDTRVDISDVGQAAYDAFQGAVIGIDRPITVPVVDRTPAGNVTKEVTIDYWELAVLLGQYAWLLGIAVMAVISLVSYIKLRKLLAEAVRLNGNIYQVDNIPSPFVMGLLRPKIYLPSGLTEQEKEYILLHEQHHIHRGDHIIKAVSYAALCLHWFNPLVWIAFTLSGRDMEMSCDEAVLKKLGGEVRADYSDSLLRFSVGRTTISGAPLAFGEGDAGKRIRNLKRWKKPILWVSVLAGILCTIVLIFCAVDSNDSSSDPGFTTPPETTMTVPPETTVPPTTTEPVDPHIPITFESLCFVMDEVTMLMESEDVIYISKNKYTYAGAIYAGLFFTDTIEEEPGRIKITISDDPSVFNQQRLLIWFDTMTQLHPDCYGSRTGVDYEIIFFCDYEKVGCTSIDEYANLDYIKIEALPFDYYYVGKIDVSVSFVYGDVDYDVVSEQENGGLLISGKEFYSIDFYEYEEYAKYLENKNQD